MSDEWDDAERAYGRIRADPSDVRRISDVTGYKVSNIMAIKQHLFFTPHLLDRYVHLGHAADYKVFDADSEHAACWRRLQQAPPLEADLQLLKHEAADAWYMRRHGPSYEAAHTAAQRRFPSP